MGSEGTLELHESRKIRLTRIPRIFGEVLRVGASNAWGLCGKNCTYFLWCFLQWEFKISKKIQGLREIGDSVKLSDPRSWG